MKHLVIYLLLALGCLGKIYGQTPEENLNKYWKYRDKLRKDFLKVGSEAGNSIPMCARAIGFAYSGVPLNDEDLKPSRIWYQDANIYLGHYLALLATEHKLLTSSMATTTDEATVDSLQKQLVATRNELYYALKTVNRLDQKAEVYLSQSLNNPNPSDLNGLLMRDDVGVNFHFNFQNDYSEIFQRDCDFIKTHSNHNPVKMYGIDAGEQVTYDGSNVMSLDQVTSILMGLKTVHTLVGSEMVQPTLDDSPINLKEEAKTIIFRIIDYVMNDVDGCTNNCKSFNIRNWDGLFRPAGFDLTFESPFIVKLGLDLGHAELTQMQQDDELNDMRVAFQMHPQELLDFFLSQNNPIFGEGDLSCQDNIEDMLQDHIESGEPVTIGSIRFEHLVALVDAVQDQNIDLSVGGTACLDITEQILDAVGDIEIDIEGVFCDNLAEWFFMFATYQITGIPLDLDNMPLRMLQAINLLEHDNIIDESDLCLSDLTTINDDNIHIFLELATISNKWSPEYINGVAVNSHMHWYPLLHALLHNSQAPYSYTYEGLIREEYIDTAPCAGPWDDPLWVPSNFETCEDYSAAPGTIAGWRGANRLFHPGLQETGDCDASFRGEFSGIDYMLYYNIYHLLWSQELPFYQRNLSCECVEEITSQLSLVTNLNVSRKFPDYKAKGIPIESFLAHDLTVTSSTGVLNVRNDLIICRELPEVQTTLRIENGAILNLYEENTITVREGNRIVLTAGGQLLAGLDDDNGIHTAATIVLEENAELIVEDEASVVCYGGLNLIMKPGSQFTLFGGDCITAGEGFDGIFFDANGAIISLTNATLISHDHFGHPNSTINNTEITSIHSEIHFSRSETSIFETHLDESNFNLDGSSSLFVSAPVTISHGELHVSTTSKLYIHYGNLTIGESALLDWHSNTCEIIGGNASLAFDHGQIHIPSNHEFTFEYGGQQSGFIDIKPGSTNVILNDNNSIFRIHGFGKEDLCLRITDATLKNINPQLGKFILNNCQIEMEGSGDLVTDMFFDASNCKFIGGKMALWYSPANIYACDIEQSFINSKFQKIVVKHSDFLNSALHADGSVYATENTSFDASHIHSENLSAVSFIKNCDFTNDEYIFVSDESLVEIRVTDSEFTSDGHFHSDHSPYGVFKVGGILTLKCNKFKDLNEAIHGANGCIISMTENDNSGNNQFTHCKHMIVCEDALDLKINDGYNDFSDVVTSVFTGNLNGQTCDNNGPDGECTHPELEANNNLWFHSTPPEEPDNDFHGAVTSNCDGPAEWEDCIITIVDNSPITEFTCRDKTPIGKIEKSTEYAGGNGNSETFKYVPEVNSHIANIYKDFVVGNPNITTTSFENIPLEEALLFAANTSELIDSLGNDSLSIDLFHQIVMSDIDLDDEEIRWKLLWGQRHMKSALENRFTQDEITAQSNETTFHTDVQKYVDVLNTLTYQTVPDSEYTLQYYLELDKGQLFNTLGNYEIAHELFMSLDDCEIDSLEQEILNGWILQTQAAMNETSQYFSGIALDSIIANVDSSSLLSPFNLITDTYFFGAIINGPQSVDFAACEMSERNHRIQSQPDDRVSIFPNPNQGSFTVQNMSKGIIHSIELMDRSGRCIFSSGSINSDQQTLQINLPPHIASGLYMLRINMAETSSYKTISIQ